MHVACVREQEGDGREKKRDREEEEKWGCCGRRDGIKGRGKNPKRGREMGHVVGGGAGNFPFCAAGDHGLQAELIVLTSSLSITPKPHPVLQFC